MRGVLRRTNYNKGEKIVIIIIIIIVVHLNNAIFDGGVSEACSMGVDGGETEPVLARDFVFTNDSRDPRSQ